MGLIAKRKEYGISQRQLAFKIGVSPQLVSKWEAGLQDMPPRHARKIAKILGCNWKDLYED